MPSGRPPTPMVIRTCRRTGCGVTFEVKPYDVRYGGGKQYCSPVCVRKVQKKSFWTGGYD